MKILQTSIAALAACLIASSAQTAHAGSCDSGTKIMSDVWAEHDEVVKKLGCAIVAVASEGMVPPNACLDAADKTAKVATQMIAFWNKMAGDGWAKIGPREFKLGSVNKGTLVSTGGRMFITSTPLEKDGLDIKIKKTDGKAKTHVTICKDNHGKKTKLAEFDIENGKDNVGKVFSRSLSGVRGHLVSVHLDAGSVANTFSYELTGTKR